MKIQQSTIQKIYISEIDRLDPITVILEDLGPSRGKIIIECYSESWAAFWGGMGDRSIAEFFCSCDVHYLAKNLSNIDPDILDVDKLVDHAKERILRLRMQSEINGSEAREMFDNVDVLSDGYAGNESLLYEIFGSEWWHQLPEKQNPKYEYLCRIIKTVKSALKSIVIDKAA